MYDRNGLSKLEILKIDGFEGAKKVTRLHETKGRLKQLSITLVKSAKSQHPKWGKSYAVFKWLISFSRNNPKVKWLLTTYIEFTQTGCNVQFSKPVAAQLHLNVIHNFSHVHVLGGEWLQKEYDSVITNQWTKPTFQFVWKILKMAS